jgi:ATP-dependent Lon protease
MSEARSEVPLDEVPVFPLSGVVLLPGQRMPLHIFEPRYRAMVRDVLEGAAHIAIACVAANEARDPPRFASVATAGRIVAHQRLPDGRFNILIEGVVRVRLVELPFVPPYRRAKATLLGDPTVDAAEVSPTMRAGLLSLMSQVISAARSRQTRFDFDAPTELPTGLLATRLVDRFVTAASWRQRFLEADDNNTRVQVATAALADVLAEGGVFVVSGNA